MDVEDRVTSWGGDAAFLFECVPLNLTFRRLVLRFPFLCGPGSVSAEEVAVQLQLRSTPAGRLLAF